MSPELYHLIEHIGVMRKFDGRKTLEDMEHTALASVAYDLIVAVKEAADRNLSIEGQLRAMLKALE